MKQFTNYKIKNMYSNCCGAEASYLSDELCGSCLEHAVFNEIEE